MATAREHRQRREDPLDLGSERAEVRFVASAARVDGTPRSRQRRVLRPREDRFCVGGGDCVTNCLERGRGDARIDRHVVVDAREVVGVDGRERVEGGENLDDQRGVRRERLVPRGGEL